MNTPRRLLPFLAAALVFLGLSAIFLFRNMDIRRDARLAQSIKFLPVANELHYWKITQERPQNFTWPRPSTQRFLCWNSWKAGFNNERISLELAFTLALVWNRTLVLPPQYKHYNLNQFTYEEFWEIEDIKQMVPVLSYDEFRNNYEPKLGDDYKDMDRFGPVLDWKDIFHFKGITVFPELPDKEKDPQTWARLTKFATQKRMEILHTYANVPGLADSRVVYFPAHTLFAPFFAYVFTTDPLLDKYIRRSVRDWVHLKGKIFDAAKLVLNELPPNITTLHIRRGDFQYKDQRHLTGDTIYANVKGLLPPDGDVYIATDENNRETFEKEFGKAFTDNGHKVHIMADYIHILKDRVPSTWIGPIEQVICSRGLRFIGTKLSTYTGYINRIRGYMPDISDKNIYFTDTKFPSGYDDRRVFPTEWPTWNDYWVNYAMWGMEYKESWTDLD